MRVRALGLTAFGAPRYPLGLVPGQNPDSDGPGRSRRHQASGPAM